MLVEGRRTHAEKDMKDSCDCDIIISTGVYSISRNVNVTFYGTFGDQIFYSAFQIRSLKGQIYTLHHIVITDHRDYNTMNCMKMAWIGCKLYIRAKFYMLSASVGGYEILHAHPL